MTQTPETTSRRTDPTVRKLEWLGAESERGATVMAPLLQLTVAGLRFRRLTIGLPIVSIVVTLAVSLIWPRTYTTTSSFVPQSQELPLSRLAGLASQFGFNLPTQNAAQSADFYADLATAQAILGPIVETHFEGTGSSELDRATLVRLLRAKGADSAARHEDAIKRLRQALAVNADAKTSVVTLTVKTRWPSVSQHVAAAIIDGITDFDLHTRQSRASAERQFTETRLEQARLELRGAEDELQAFLIRNRQYRESPSLQFQYDRLSREVVSRQQVFDALRQSYEEARIEEVRNTPRITVLEPGNLPARPDSRHLVLRTLLAGILGLLLGLGAALIAQGLSHSRAEQPAAAEELVDLWRGLLRDLRKPWRLFSSGSAGG